MISIICAMDEKRGIGKDNSIPWHISQDFNHFKQITLNHPIIMGRRTFESLGRMLPDRTHVVVTHDLKNKTEVENLYWVDSIESAIEVAQKQKGSDEIFIIGGGEIFKEALEKEFVEKLYLTIIDGDYSADTFFPDYSRFKIISEKNKEEGKYKFKFLELTK